MESLFTEPIVLVASSVAVIAAGLAWSIRSGQSFERSGGRFGFLALPGLLEVAAFYSLAIHMHSRLGGWPDFIGTEQLPSELATHAEISGWVFAIVLVVALGMPLVMALYAMVPRLRSHMIDPAFCGAACWSCLFLTALAPAGFQQWWWD